MTPKKSRIHGCLTVLSIILYFIYTPEIGPLGLNLNYKSETIGICNEDFDHQTLASMSKQVEYKIFWAK